MKSSRYIQSSRISPLVWEDHWWFRLILAGLSLLLRGRFAFLYAAIKSLYKNDPVYMDRAAKKHTLGFKLSLRLEIEGIVKYALGCQEEGLTLLRKAANLIDTPAGYHTMLDYEINAEQWARAALLAKQRLAIDPCDTKVLCRWAHILNKFDGYWAAEPYLHEVLDMYAHWAWAYQALGRVYFHTQRYGEGEKACRQSLELYGDDVPEELWVKLILCIACNSNVESAFEMLQHAEARGLDPASAKPIRKELSGDRSMGVECYREGGYFEAYSYLTIEAKRDSGNELSLLYKAAIDSVWSHSVDAIEKLPASVREGIPSDEYTSTVGSVYFDCGLQEKGLTWMRKAYAENPKHENAFALGSRLVLHGECFAEAEALFAGLIEQDEADSFALCWQGFLLCEKKQWDQSKESFERALRVDDSFAHAHSGIGMILEERKDYENALMAYQRSIDCRIYQVWLSWQGVAACFRMLGDEQQADLATQIAEELERSGPIARSKACPVPTEKPIPTDLKRN